MSVVTIDYTNWRDERSLRRVAPGRFYYGTSDWHPEPQWLMEAFDLDHAAVRTFALAGVHSWSERPAANAAATGGSGSATVPRPRRPDGCGRPEKDLECAGCGVRLYGVRVEDVCPYAKGEGR